MDAFLNSLGLNLLYLALLAAGVIYAVFILIGGALGHLHLPGLDVDLGGHHVGRCTWAWRWTRRWARSLNPSSRPSPSPVSSRLWRLRSDCHLDYSNSSARASLLWAVGGGLVVAVIAHFAFGYFLIAPQGSSEVHLMDIVGAAAEVTTPIPADSVGEVAFVAQGGRVTYTAKSASGLPIARGTTVVIEKVVGGVAVVRLQE